MPMNSLDAAERILKEAGEPLHSDEITRRVLAKGLWTTTGKTPAATINARLGEDIKRNGERSRFMRRGRSVFGLRDAGHSPVTSPASRSASTGSRFIRTARSGAADLESEIKKVRGYGRSLNESKTRSFLVEPILKRLGWDSPEVMDPERPVGGRQRVKVDIALLPRGKIEVMVEVKPDKLSERHEKQLLEYCRLEDVSLGVLTNGRIWKLYYGMHTRKKSHLAEVIDITQGDVHAVASQMASFLGFKMSKVERQRVFKSAWERRSNDPQRTIQEAWSRMRREFVPQLTDALMVSLRQSGETVSRDIVLAFVRGKIASQKQNVPDTKGNVTAGPVPKLQTLPEGEPASRSTSHQRPIPGTRPEAIEVFGKQVLVRSWREMMLVFLEEVYKRKRKEFFDKVVNHRPQRFARSTAEPTSIKIPRQIGESDVWVSGHGSADTLWKVCESVRTTLDLPEDVLILR